MAKHEQILVLDPPTDLKFKGRRERAAARGGAGGRRDLGWVGGSREGRRRAASERPLPHAPALSILRRRPAPALGLPAPRPDRSLPRPLAAGCARRPGRGGGARPWRRRHSRHLAVPRGCLPGAARAAARAWHSSLAPDGRRALSGRVWVGGDLRACAWVCGGKEGFWGWRECVGRGRRLSAAVGGEARQGGCTAALDSVPRENHLLALSRGWVEPALGPRRGCWCLPFYLV